jgi:hypothetical protein
MTKWEYQILRIQDALNINQYGDQGWELIAVVVVTGSVVYYFKRPIL